MAGPALTPADLGQPVFEASLAVQLFWAVTIQPNGDLFLPTMARDLGYLPRAAKGEIVLATYREVIHLWAVPAYMAEGQRLQGRWGDLVGSLALSNEEDSAEGDR